MRRKKKRKVIKIYSNKDFIYLLIYYMLNKKGILNILNINNRNL